MISRIRTAHAWRLHTRLPFETCFVCIRESENNKNIYLRFPVFLVCIRNEMSTRVLWEQVEAILNKWTEDIEREENAARACISRFLVRTHVHTMTLRLINACHRRRPFLPTQW